MPTDYRLHIDPAEVLGVSRDAKLSEIREAYRNKAKKYHPDAGGEEWAFRVLVQSYEFLCTARVANVSDRLETEVPNRPWPQPTTSSYVPPRPPPPEPGPPPFKGDAHRPPPRARGDAHESVRPGVQEPAIDPTQVVDIEKMTIRFEAEHVWLITERATESRLLSCSLNITWPDPALHVPPSTILGADGILQSLGGVFERLSSETRAITARSTVVDGRFTAWISYPNDERAQAAFAKLREGLHGIGLVVKQWSRDLVIPRQWR